MRAALSRSCAFGVVLVVLAVLAVPTLAAPDVPTDLAAVAVSDHRVDLSWQWPATPTYPDELQVWRGGTYVTSVDVTDSSFVDPDAPTPGATYTYHLRTIDSGRSTDTAGATAHMRNDLPNAPANVSATFQSGTNIATVTWDRGAQDADVTYNVTATPVGGGSTIPGTQRYDAGDPSGGSATLDGATSSTSYTFSVVADEDQDDPPGDPGGDVSASPAETDPVPSHDTIAPVFSSPALAPSSPALGTVSVAWPSASDQGSGIWFFHVCVDSVTCKDAPADAQGYSVPGVANDGASHPISVAAIDREGNSSAPLSTFQTMPLPATPSISFAPGIGDGCTTLLPTVSSKDGTQPAFHLFADGIEVPLGQSIGGAPYSIVQLTAQATYGTDSSALSPGQDVRVGDLDGPETSPAVRGQLDIVSGTETISWAPVSATGAGVVGYRITSTNIPGYTGAGLLIPLSTSPQWQFAGLDQSANYTAHVTAIDACGRASDDPVQFTFFLGDVIAPTAPTFTGSSSSGNSVHLVWSPAFDAVQVDDYEIYRGPTKVGEVAGSVTAFDDKGLADATTYGYRVRALDTAGNPGPFSAIRPVTTRDATAPGPPGNPTARASGNAVTVSWSPAYDAVGVTGYQIVRDGMFVKNVPTTEFVDTSVPIGSHVWQVRAYDAAGNVSAPRETIPVATTAAIPPVQASRIKPIAPKGSKRWVKLAGRSGLRLVLTFKLSQRIAPAVLHVRVLRGKAKLRISLPSGTGRTTAGKRLAERLVKRGSFALALGNMPAGTLRLIVTASRGTQLMLAGIGAARLPSVGPKA